MALSPQLLQFKSSGVYRLEFDKSQTVNIPAETIRLIVGHSKKGPYNSPVLIDSVEQFINVFGSIDRNLEKKGMFFHRSALTALTRGPILALNLAKFDSADLISYAAPVTDASDALLTAIENENEYSKFFNTEKFWTPSDDAVNNVIGNAITGNVLRFANIKQDPITVIVRQAQDVKPFNITAREWYGEGNVPAYLNDFDYMSDFMVDVFVFKGGFDAAVMDTDPIYGEFFTADGLDKTKLAEFANLRQVSLIAQYTGSILPGFTDLEGNQMYVETMINSEARRTGLFCAVLEDAVLDETGTKADLIGHSGDSLDALSYSLSTNDRDVDVDTTAGTGWVYAAGSNTATFTYTGSSLPNFDLKVGHYIHAEEANRLAKVTRIIKNESTGAGTPASYTAATVSLPALGDDGVNGVTTTVSGSTLTVTNLDLTAVSGIAVNKYLAGATAGTYVKITAVTATTITCDASISSAYDAIDTSGGATNIAVYTYIAAVPGPLTTTYTVYIHTTPKQSAFVGAYSSYEEAASVYYPFVLDGALIGTQSILDCLDAVNTGTNLGNTLADKDSITYRYIVDTFGSYEAANGILNKSQLSNLAKTRQNAAAILNAPMIFEFKVSTNPSFIDDNGAFNVNYVATGGNLDKNPTALYSLPSINEGANFAFYYGPGLVVRENNKDLIVPPAAYVSNNFIDKYTDSLPWAIVAGPRRGVVSGSGVSGAEYAFDKADRDVLEPFGYNPIVFQRGVGLTILGNKTAQQSVQSALSSAHVREVLIFIQEGIANILKDYVFEFNTAQTRLEIKTLADSFMESVKADFGVYDYKNVMDTTNNTNDVIDANMGIVDTYVEPVKGLEIVVHRTTILNTGEISTGNFS